MTRHRATRRGAFAALHVPGDPVILYNAWDAGSAKAVAEAGAKAIATGSASVAAAHGYRDAEGLPLELALANAGAGGRGGRAAGDDRFRGRLCGRARRRSAANMARLAATGAIGCNFEDQVVGGEGLHPIEVQAARIRGGRAAAVGPDFFINARTDIFLKARPATHDDGQGRRGAGAGARPMPRRARAASSCPGSPISAAGAGLRGLAAAGQFHGLSRRAFGRGRSPRPGVARISHGPFPHMLAMKALKEAAAAGDGLGPANAPSLPAP